MDEYIITYEATASIQGYWTADTTFDCDWWYTYLELI